MKKIVAIIPARGGSKRLPKKNIIDFCGKPMIAWTIEAAKEALKADIFVSTDADDIAEIAKEYGAKVIMRKTGCDDHTTVQEATIITLEQIHDELGLDYDYVVQLMACCPLRDANDIKKAFHNFRMGGWDFQLSYHLDVYNHWAVEVDEKHRAVQIEPEAFKTRSQDLTKRWIVNGAIWIADVAELIKYGTFYGPDHTLFEIDEDHGMDIDTPRQYKKARL